MSFVDPAFDWYSAPVPAIIYVISYNIVPRYNGTPLYFLPNKDFYGLGQDVFFKIYILYCIAGIGVIR